MSSPFVNSRGECLPSENILGNGNSAVVVLENGIAVKMPLRYMWSSYYDVEMNLKSLKHEQDVYHRLQSPDDNRSKGIVNCIGFLPEATQLAYLCNGDLRTYLSKHDPPRHLQLQWFCDMSRTLSYIHEKRVLVADIASRNFLLDSDLSVKFSDFSEASLFPLTTDMEVADDNGYTTLTDIGLLGGVMYEVVSGEKCEIDLYKYNTPTDGRAYWPKRELLPNTQGIWLGCIIEGCWSGKFRDAHSLLAALTTITLLRASGSQ